MIMLNHQSCGYDGYKQTAQVLPLASLMYPLSPQVAAQEFLIFQYPSVAPTKSTPWLTAVPQLAKTPLLYAPQLLASTATDTGVLERAVRRSSHPVSISTYPEILYDPESILHCWSLAT